MNIRQNKFANTSFHNNNNKSLASKLNIIVYPQPNSTQLNPIDTPGEKIHQIYYVSIFIHSFIHISFNSQLTQVINERPSGESQTAIGAIAILTLSLALVWAP